MFGETDYDASRCISFISFEEQLCALGRAVDAGKVCNDSGKDFPVFFLFSWLGHVLTW